MKDNIRILLLVVICAGIWFSVLRRPQAPKSAVKSAIYDSVVSMVKRDMQAQLQARDAAIQYLMQRDSAIEAKLPLLYERINQTRSRVNSLSADDLYREISKAYPPE